MDEATSNRGPLMCMTCGTEYTDLREDAHYERRYWWCKVCAAIVDGKLAEFPSKGKLVPKSILTEDD